MTDEPILIHTCEVCGKSELLTPTDAYNVGWDYPPKMGAFGVISLRTCGDCSIKDTLWWALAMEHTNQHDLTPQQRETLVRIQGEPGSIIPTCG